MKSDIQEMEEWIYYAVVFIYPVLAVSSAGKCRNKTYYFVVKICTNTLPADIVK